MVLHNFKQWYIIQMNLNERRLKVNVKNKLYKHADVKGLYKKVRHPESVVVRAAGYFLPCFPLKGGWREAVYGTGNLSPAEIPEPVRR